MAKPPETSASSDIEGVNRDARAGSPSREGHPDPGGAVAGAKSETKARPGESPPHLDKGG